MARPASMRIGSCVVFALVAICGSGALRGASAGETAPLWRIGRSDDDTRDLALGPKGYARFPAAFPEDPIFVVGRSDPKRDWPYAHPGPADGWAGGKRHTFRIFFALGAPERAGACRLVFDLVDTHYARPPALRIEVNGKSFDVRLPKGAADASITGDPAAGRAHTFRVEIPAGVLEAGLNEIAITTRAGSWFLYDAIAFEGPRGLELGEARGTLVRSMDLDPWLERREGKPCQMLRLRIFQIGGASEATLRVADLPPFRLTFRPGAQTVEVPLPPAMKKRRDAVVLASGGATAAKRMIAREPAVERQPVDWVDPLLGTSTSRWMLYPGPSMPFGMVKLSPDNQDQGWMAGYEYGIENIAGFSHLHAWTMGGLLMMPGTGELRTRPGPQGDPDRGYRSRFRHETETASPGYYAVTLEDYGIRAELTSTTRAGFARFTFPRAGKAWILFDLQFPTEYGFTVLDARVRKVSPTEIEGHSRQRSGRYASWNEFTVHFVAVFDRPFATFGGWTGEARHGDVPEIAGKGDVGAFVRYATEKGDRIRVKTGISLVDLEGARRNLRAEMGRFGWDFDAVRRHARETWNDLLGKIEVEGGTGADTAKFYTNLYRSYCARTIWSDVDGRYVDMCEKVRKLPDPDSPVYGCDAFWNTFWNLNQLWTLVNPDIAGKWVRSLLEIYDRGGWLAKGPTGIEYSSIMVASHEIALIVAAYQKGIRDFDVGEAYEAMRRIQTEPGRPHPCGGHVGNRQLEPYMKLGYVPREKGPISNTLEYAYDDWCVAQMAKALGKEDDYRAFMARARNYRNAFDPSVGYMRERHADGTWAKPFSPYGGRGFVEGNAWQYTWFVPHDVGGLIELMGREEFNRRLEEGFEAARANRFNATRTINHGNQPNMQAAYLFNYSGKPWLTQKWARAIMDLYYGLGPYDGYPGDEDQGQMGAWFVMSAMGLFEMDGGASVRPIYEIGSPLFEKVAIHLDPKVYGGGTFVIEAKNASKENVYVQSATLNGEPLDRPWFHHARIRGGGSLVLEMGPKPNARWGSAPDAAPPSMPRDP